MSIKPPSTRLAMPEPRPLFAGLGMILLGAIMVGTRQSQWRDLGWALIVLGGATGGWWTVEAWRVVQYRRATEAEAARRSTLQTARRQKEEEERTQRDKEKKVREEQAARLRDQRSEEGRRRRESDEAAARERAAREAEIEAEVARLKGLDADSLGNEVITRLRAREYEVQSDDLSPSGMLLVKYGSPAAACRIVAGRPGRKSDVQEIEAWRRDAGAGEAFLICLSGFAPEAVRAAQDKPITLVEGHLLATWGTTGAGTERRP